MSDIFEKAIRQKLRFDSPKGPLSAEDLFDLPLQSATGKANLDTIAVSLDQELKTQNVSFVSDVTPRNTQTQLKFDIVKYVIAVRKDENAAAASAAERAAQKQKLLGVLDRRRNEAVETMSEAEILKALEAL